MSEQHTYPMASATAGITVGTNVVAAFASNIHSERYETYVLVDGRRFRSHNDGPWQELSPVPGTFAAMPRRSAAVSDEVIPVAVIPGTESTTEPVVSESVPADAVSTPVSTEAVSVATETTAPATTEPVATEPVATETAPVDPPTEVTG